MAAAFFEVSALASEVAAAFLLDKAEEALAAAFVAEVAAEAAEVVAAWMAVMLSATSCTSVMLAATVAILELPAPGVVLAGSVIDPRSDTCAVATPRSEPTMAMSALAPATRATAGYS